MLRGIIYSTSLLCQVILAVGGTLSFCVVEWEYHRNEKQHEKNLASSYEEPSDGQYTITRKTQSASTLNDEDGFVSDSSAY